VNTRREVLVVRHITLSAVFERIDADAYLAWPATLAAVETHRVVGAKQVELGR
jgi:hypothetical protein